MMIARALVVLSSSSILSSVVVDGLMVASNAPSSTIGIHRAGRPNSVAPASRSKSPRSVTVGQCQNDDDDDGMPASHPPPPRVLCVGETLWDSLPSGMYLGGAPANVAMHLASLLRGIASGSASSSIDDDDDDDDDDTVAVAACIGNDRLGKESIRRLKSFGVRTDYVQHHDIWETGMAIANIDENGDAMYDFVTPAAWDGLIMNDDLRRLMTRDGGRECDTSNDDDGSTNSGTGVIYVMGTIASRMQYDDVDGGDGSGATSANTVYAIRNDAPDDTVVLDVNLRSPWYTPETVLELARGRKIVDDNDDGDDDDDGDGSSGRRRNRRLALLKLNEEELSVLGGWCELDIDDDGHDEDRADRASSSTSYHCSAIANDNDGESRGGGIHSSTSSMSSQKGSSSTSSHSSKSSALIKRRMEVLGRHLNARRVCVTRGGDGAAIWCDDDDDDDDVDDVEYGRGTYHEHPGYGPLLRENGNDNDGDSVGAGDAFLAGLVCSLLIRNETPDRALERACALGGYVAICRGATPDHDDAPDSLRSIFSFR